MSNEKQDRRREERRNAQTSEPVARWAETPVTNAILSKYVGQQPSNNELSDLMTQCRKFEIQVAALKAELAALREDAQNITHVVAYCRGSWESLPNDVRKELIKMLAKFGARGGFSQSDFDQAARRIFQLPASETKK